PGLPYLRLRDLGIIPSSEAGGFAFISLDPWLNARHVVHYLGHQAVGPAGYALSLVAIAPPWRGAPWARLLGVTLTLVGTLAAFGIGIPIGGHVIATPYRLLAAWLPGLSTVRMPARFVVVTQLGLALLAGLGTERLLGRRSARAGWLAAVATVVLALVTFDARPALPLHVEPTGAGVPAVYRWLAAHGGGGPLPAPPPG